MIDSAQRGRRLDVVSKCFSNEKIIVHNLCKLSTNVKMAKSNYTSISRGQIAMEVGDNQNSNGVNIGSL